MYKKNSDNIQGRKWRQSEFSAKNTCGIDKTAFSNDQLAVRDRILCDQISQIEIKLGRVKSMIDEAHIRRGTWASRSVPLDVQARWVQEKRLLLGELNAARMEHNKLSAEIRRRHALEYKQSTESFDAAFHAMAKEILAGPVYDRIVTATIHRIGETKQANP